jgi:hypothetical protein
MEISSDSPYEAYIAGLAAELYYHPFGRRPPFFDAGC